MLSSTSARAAKDGADSTPDGLAWIQEYLESLRAEDYAESTVTSYGRRLRRIESDLKGQGIRLEDLLDEKVFVAYLDRWAKACEERSGNSPTRYARSGIVTIVNGFVRWSQGKGYLPSESAPARPTVLCDYIEFCQHHQGLSRDTLQVYRRYLTELAEFLHQRGQSQLVAIPLPALDEFLALRCEGMARTSRCLVVHTLRRFLSYLFLYGYESRDRSDWLEYPPVFTQMKLPSHLEDPQLEQALAGIDRSTAVGKRDWAIMMILVHYGLRAGEVTQLCLHSVDFENHKLRVLRLKGGGEQVLPLVSGVATALREYVEHVRPESSHSELFLTMKAPYRPLQRASLSDRVRTVLRDLPDVPARGAHVLRHTLARNLRRDGATLGVISGVLGHRNFESTAAYLRIAIDELREVADNYAELL